MMSVDDHRCVIARTLSTYATYFLFVISLQTAVISSSSKSSKDAKGSMDRTIRLPLRGRVGMLDVSRRRVFKQVFSQFNHNNSRRYSLIPLSAIRFLT